MWEGGHWHHHPNPHVTLKVLAKKSNNSLITKDWIGDKPHRMTTDTRASLITNRPDIIAGLPKRKPNRLSILEMA
jgi:hypothetical protein